MAEIIKGIKLSDGSIAKIDYNSLANLPSNSGSGNLDNYYTKTEIDNKGFQTASQVESAINKALGVIENGSY